MLGRKAGQLYGRAPGADGLLRWATASELNNAYFEVESSADGRTFQPLGRVAGQGTTSQPQQYQLTDAGLARYAAELVYYRLRQVDYGGLSTYSPVRTLLVPGGAFAVEAFPTHLPTGQVLSLRVRTPTAGPATLLVTDVLGRLVQQQTLDLAAATNTFVLPQVEQWAQGLYLLRVQQGEQQQVSKVVRE